ncbi:SsrA-binding protein SmpB [Candidatus Uhrbacteria bacterium]|nr:SsrA-binding protein SmpB [Candidatus Uhrbacteria bacterium]
MPYLAKNERALYDYHILERLEAGIVLSGSEVKAVKAGTVTLKGSFAHIRNGELFLDHMHISPYPPAGHVAEYDPRHPRKLLLKKRELRRLIGKLNEKGLTVVPLGVYTKATRIKVEIGMARGKRTYEKREIIKKRSIERSIHEALKRP